MDDVDGIRIATSAIVECPRTSLGVGVQIWHLTHVRDGAVIGQGTRVGSHCVIDRDVLIGANCKIQSHAMIFRGARIHSQVFIGPGAMLLNDKHPRACRKDGKPQTDADWKCEGVTIRSRASIGAGCILMPGIEIGEGAMIGAGSIVTRDVPAWTVWHGEAARPRA